MNYRHKKITRVSRTYDKSIYKFNKIENNLNEICKKYPYLPTFVEKVDRIIGIGDIHGDLDLTINFLKVGKLIDEINEDEFKINECIKIPMNMTAKEFQDNYNILSEILMTTKKGTFKHFKYFKWIGNNTNVVQVGDQIDRCRPFSNSDCMDDGITIDDENSDLLIMEIFDCLHKIALNFNGAVYSLIGNHEVMNFDGDFRYVSQRGIIDYSNNDLIHERNEEFNKLRKKFACSRNAIIVIGNYIFVHGGLSHLLISEYKLEDINEIIRLYIYNNLNDIKDIKLKNIYKNIVNSSTISPLWFRKLAMIPPDNSSTTELHKDCYTYYEPLVEHFQINELIELKGLIIGHTPQLSVHNKGINMACNNKIMRIDIGASKAFNKMFNKNDVNRKPQVIEILNNEKVNILF